MNSYYDNILIKFVEEQEINYTIISNLSYYIENLSKHFLFVGERLDFNNLSNHKFVKSEQRDISFDAVNFIKKLIEEKMCSKDDAIIYIGDSLTENGYEFYLNDLLKIVPFLVNEIPQHHYFLSKDFKKIIYISFENEIEFGDVS
jgi:hypothetical protein